MAVAASELARTAGRASGDTCKVSRMEAGGRTIVAMPSAKDVMPKVRTVMEVGEGNGRDFIVAAMEFCKNLSRIRAAWCVCLLGREVR